ncbi:unnamed protein product [Urochloa humidicola]
MSQHKRRCRAFTAEPPPEATTAARTPTLPSDLVLKMVARSDVATLLRCAASPPQQHPQPSLHPSRLPRAQHRRAAAPAHLPPELLQVLSPIRLFPAAAALLAGAPSDARRRVHIR